MTTKMREGSRDRDNNINEHARYGIYELLLIIITINSDETQQRRRAVLFSSFRRHRRHERRFANSYCVLFFICDE